MLQLAKNQPRRDIVRCFVLEYTMSFDRVGTEQAPITPSQKRASNYSSVSSIRVPRMLSGRTAHELSACFTCVSVPSQRSRKTMATARN